MKDGSTHLAHKAEHAVDMETGAVVAVTLQGADQGDTTTIVETLSQAGTQIAEVAVAVNNEEAGERVNPEGPAELVTDKGYHSNAVLKDLKEVGVRSYIPGTGSWPAQLGRQGNRTSGCVWQSAAYTRSPRQAVAEAARREVRAIICAPVRNRRHETDAPAWAQEHTQTLGCACRSV